MATLSTTESSFTDLADRDNLTDLHRQSGLETTHQSRLTKTVFLIQGDLFARYVPTLPTKRPKSSWIWKHEGKIHGEAMSEKDTGKAVWLCTACYNLP
jgi:hypothetical protein